MSIENLLTLGVAAGILAVAFVLRLLFLGALRLFYLLSGKEVARAETAETAEAADGERPARPRRPLTRPALNGLGALGRGVILVFATLGTWMFVAGGAIGRVATSGYTSLSPRVAAGTKTGVTMGAGKLKTFAVVAIATLQHLAQAIAGMVNERLAQAAARRREQQAPVEEPQEATVIRLDREWDPLTDPLEDMPVSNYR